MPKIGGYLGTVVDAELVTATAIVYDPKHKHEQRGRCRGHTKRPHHRGSTGGNQRQKHLGIGEWIMVGTEPSLVFQQFRGQRLLRHFGGKNNMVIDKKGKLFGKISVLDLIVIVVLIVAVVGCIYKFGTGKANLEPLFPAAIRP